MPCDGEPSCARCGVVIHIISQECARYTDAIRRLHRTLPLEHARVQPSPTFSNKHSPRIPILARALARLAELPRGDGEARAVSATNNLHRRGQPSAPIRRRRGAIRRRNPRRYRPPASRSRRRPRLECGRSGLRRSLGIGSQFGDVDALSRMVREALPTALHPAVTPLASQPLDV